MKLLCWYSKAGISLNLRPSRATAVFLLGQGLQCCFRVSASAQDVASQSQFSLLVKGTVCILMRINCAPHCPQKRENISWPRETLFREIKLGMYSVLLVSINGLKWRGLFKEGQVNKNLPGLLTSVSFSSSETDWCSKSRCLVIYKLQ